MQQLLSDEGWCPMTIKDREGFVKGPCPVVEIVAQHEAESEEQQTHVIHRSPTWP